jgi:hypothetical protein
MINFKISYARTGPDHNTTYSVNCSGSYTNYVDQQVSSSDFWSSTTMRFRTTFKVETKIKTVPKVNTVALLDMMLLSETMSHFKEDDLYVEVFSDAVTTSVQCPPDKQRYVVKKSGILVFKDLAIPCTRSATI